MPASTNVSHPLDIIPWFGRGQPTRWLSYAFTAVALIFLFAMLGLFIWQSVPAWQHEGWGYLTGHRWFYRADLFGVLPMIYGTVAVAATALLIAGSIGIGAAIFTAEYLPDRLRFTVKVIIELLAGIPSVVYGLLGVLFLRNWVYQWLAPFDPLSGDTLLTAGILLGVMVLPTVMTLSDDALRGVPKAQRTAARSLGLNRGETIWFTVLPQAKRGILAALLLGLGRALGETIAVFLVIGRQDNQWPESLLSLRPLINAGQTLTSKLGGSETHIAYGDPLHWGAMVGLGLILLLLVIAVTLFGGWLAERNRHDT
jgi:phosphate transport system permease protein